MDKRVLNWQNFAQVGLQLEFAFRIGPKDFPSLSLNKSSTMAPDRNIFSFQFTVSFVAILHTCHSMQESNYLHRN